MSLISLRNLPGPVEKAVKARARERGLSLNRAVLSLLEEALGGTRPRKRRDDLDREVHDAPRHRRAGALGHLPARRA